MVRKYGKYDVRSGNTFRLSPSCVNLKRYKTQACLVRETIFRNTLDKLQRQEQDAFAEKYRLGDTVVYSLNKRQRWKIPEQLKEFVEERIGEDEEIKYSLIEKDKLKNHINCRSYTTSIGDVNSVVATSHTYLGKRQRRASSRSTRVIHEHYDDYKKHVLYIDRPIIGVGAEKTEAVAGIDVDIQRDTVNVIKRVEMYPVRIRLPYNETVASVLRLNYGSIYEECRCYPRKFVIDISSLLVDMVKHSKHLAGQFPTKIGTWCWLAFVRDGKCSDDACLDIYQVYLNAELNMNPVRIETLCDMTVYTLDEVVNRTLCFFETLPYDCFQMTELRHHIQSQSKFQMMPYQPVFGSSSYTVDEMLRKKLTGRNVHDDDIYQTMLQDSVADMGQFCNICFESIGTLIDNNIGVTSLKDCEHCFCNPCWREYLQNQMTSGHTRVIQCPDLECKATLDWATALTLVPIGIYVTYAKKLYSLQVQRERNRKWCPNPKCGRVLELNGANSISSVYMTSISCVCGQNLCFQCLWEWHWPASCEQAKVYQQKLETHGEVTIAPLPSNSKTLVNVKKCPVCNEPIEKFEGCPSMICICGVNFCWDCRKPYPHIGWCENSRYHSGLDYSDADLKGTQEVELETIDRRVIKSKTRTRAYVTAIRHRMARHPDGIKKIQNALTELKTKIKPKDYQRLGKLFSLRPGERVKPCVVSQCFSDIAPFYAELQAIAEHTAAISDAQGDFEFLFCKYEHQMDYICSRFEYILKSLDGYSVYEIIALIFDLKSRANNCIARLIQIVENLTCSKIRAC